MGADFINGYEGIKSCEEYRADLSVMYLLRGDGTRVMQSRLSSELRRKGMVNFFEAQLWPPNERALIVKS